MHTGLRLLMSHIPARLALALTQVKELQNGVILQESSSQ